MSKKVNPTAIGLFIVIGVALGVIALIVFSSGRLFSKREKFILYFDASLKGLSPGAPVKVRGVSIGSVVDVFISRNQAKNDYAMPVIIEIDQRLLHERSDRGLNITEPTMLQEAIRRGLRAHLDASSLVTGVLYVDLRIDTNAAPPVFHQIGSDYREIPTAPTEIQELLANLARLDIAGISDKLNVLLAKLDSSLGQLNMKAINDGVTNLLVSADRLIGSPDLTNSLAELKNALTDARGLVKRLEGRVDPLADGLTNTLHQADRAIADLRRGLQGLGGMVEPDAPFRADLTTTLGQLGHAARSIADLAEFLQRNPNALLTGRTPPQAKP